MKSKIQVDVDDAWRIYELIEEMHSFMHQPLNTADPKRMRAWLEDGGVYAELKDIYYNLVGEWFPVNKETGTVDPPGGTIRRFSSR